MVRDGINWLECFVWDETMRCIWGDVCRYYRAHNRGCMSRVHSKHNFVYL